MYPPTHCACSGGGASPQDAALEVKAPKEYLGLIAGRGTSGTSRIPSFLFFFLFLFLLLCLSCSFSFSFCFSSSSSFSYSFWFSSSSSSSSSFSFAFSFPFLLPFPFPYAFMFPLLFFFRRGLQGPRACGGFGDPEVPRISGIPEFLLFCLFFFCYAFTYFFLPSLWVGVSKWAWCSWTSTCCHASAVGPWSTST